MATLRTCIPDSVMDELKALMAARREKLPEALEYAITLARYTQDMNGKILIEKQAGEVKAVRIR
jgi:rRNA-processing protein FCF1